MNKDELDDVNMLGLQKAAVMLLSQILDELRVLNDSQSLLKKPQTPDVG